MKIVKFIFLNVLPSILILWMVYSFTNWDINPKNWHGCTQDRNNFVSQLIFAIPLAYLIGLLRKSFQEEAEEKAKTKNNFDTYL